MTGLLLLVVSGVAAWTWWHLLHAKERARRAAMLACREHGLQLMDDTVVFDAVQLHTPRSSRSYGLRYRFNFARDGILRTGGSVLVRPGRPAMVIITTSSGQVIEEIGS